MSLLMVRSNTNNLLQRILLVGEVSKAFLDAGTITNERYEVCRNILDAIDIAAKNSFLAIGIVLVGVSERLSSALKDLREVSPDTKIILLAQIYQEPIAKAIVESVTGGGSLADDYLICPIKLDNFYNSIVPVQGQKVAGQVIFTTTSSELERRIKLLEKLATEDDLTGLKNRRYIWEFCRQILEHAKKENGRVTLLVFDIDDFKHYNDVYGHSAGDKILKEAAILMRRCCRLPDVVGRIGGDEFAVVFWDDPHRETSVAEVERRSAMAEHPREAIFIAERFRKEFEKAELCFLGPKGKGVLTISGGLATFPRDGSTVQELLKKADEALLEAKRSGKNRIYLVGQPQDISEIE
jgi:GGDEF domain-containing protein